MKNIEKITAKLTLATKDETGVETYNASRTISSYIGLGDYIFKDAEQAELFRIAVQKDMNESNYQKALSSLVSASQKVKALKEEGAEKDKITRAENAERKATLSKNIYEKLDRGYSNNVFIKCISAYLNGDKMPNNVYYCAGLAVSRCKNPSATRDDIRRAFSDLALEMRLDGSDGLTKKMVCKMNDDYLSKFISACNAGFPHWDAKTMDVVGLDEMPLVRMAIFYFIVTMANKEKTKIEK